MVIRIAQLQLPVSPSKQKTFEQVKRAACAAAQNQIDLIALPEMFSCPYEVSAFPQYAEEEGGPSWQLGSALAKEYGVYVSAGSVPEIDSQGISIIPPMSSIGRGTALPNIARCTCLTLTLRADSIFVNPTF